jgi:hypothetical protein
MNLTFAHREDAHADFESMMRNRISNISFAVCSAGEIVVLAIMIGILKGLKSGDSTENNTRAFSVIIAFSGGVWCTLLQALLVQSIELMANKSGLCLTMVLSRETQTRTQATSRDFFANDRVQTNICCIA